MYANDVDACNVTFFLVKIVNHYRLSPALSATEIEAGEQYIRITYNCSEQCDREEEEEENEND